MADREARALIQADRENMAQKVLIGEIGINELRPTQLRVCVRAMLAFSDAEKASTVHADKVRETVARLLCEQHGGKPDAIATDEHDCWDGALWTVFQKDADAILAALAQQSAKPEVAERIIAALETEQRRLDGEDYIMDTNDCINVIREQFLASPTPVEEADRHG